MPNAVAAAPFDDDFALREPPRKKAARRSPKAKAAARRWAFLKVDPKRLLKRGAIGASGLVALGIVLNALEFQKGRHPAPLFGASLTVADQNGRLSPVAAKPQPSADAPKTPAVGDAASRDEIRAEPARAAAPPPTPLPSHAGAAPVDEIARLLQHGPAAHATQAPAAQSSAAHASAPHAPHASPRAAGEAVAHATSPASSAKAARPATAERADARTVYGVQQALVKLGFVLKPNGVLGPQTKKALEIFGKERRLPIHGTLTPRVIKILAAESGLEIEHP